MPQAEAATSPVITADYTLTSEFMKAVGIKKSKLYKMIAKNKIKPLKRSRHLYVLAIEASGILLIRMSGNSFEQTV